jgi:hypothetical protein
MFGNQPNIQPTSYKPFFVHNILGANVDLKEKKLNKQQRIKVLQKRVPFNMTNKRQDNNKRKSPESTDNNESSTPHTTGCSCTRRPGLQHPQIDTVTETTNVADRNDYTAPIQSPHYSSSTSSTHSHRSANDQRSFNHGSTSDSSQAVVVSSFSNATNSNIPNYSRNLTQSTVEFNQDSNQFDEASNDSNRDSDNDDNSQDDDSEFDNVPCLFLEAYDSQQQILRFYEEKDRNQ